MKRIVVIVAVLVMVLFACSCIKVTSESKSADRVDRVVTGQISSIDRQGEYATIYFINGGKIYVEASSLNKFNVENAFKNVWTYELHYDGYDAYVIISVSSLVTD